MLLLYPIATDRRPKRTPYVTYAIAGLNVVVALWWMWGTAQDGDVLRDLSFVPAQPTWFGLFTSMFMHGGWAHLLGNMLFLVLFGRNVEDAMGPLLFACSYLMCGAAAMVLHLAVTAAFQPDNMGVATVGASGAISGLLGLFVVRFYRTRITIWYFFLLLVRVGKFQVTSVAGIGLWFIGQLFSGTAGLAGGQGGVAYWAHIGGFIFGVGYALLVGMEGEGTAEYSLGDAQRSNSMGNWGNAMVQATRVLREDPNNAEAHLIAARSCAERDDPENSVRHFRKALELYLEAEDAAKAVVTYRAMFAALPESTLPLRAHLGLASAFARAGDHAEAASAYERIAAAAKDPREWEAAILRLGRLHLRHTKQLPQAKQAFEALLNRDPQSPNAQHAREGLARVEAETGLFRGSPS